MTSKWRRLGLQRRIMAYVTVGLLVLFSGMAYFQMRAVRDLKEQIFRERMALAEVLMGRVEKNFEFLGSDLLLIAERLQDPDKDFQSAARQISHSIQQHAPSQFFTVASILVVDDRGKLLASEPPEANPHAAVMETAVRQAMAKKQPLLFPCPGFADSNTPFALMLVPVSASRDDGGRWLVVAAEIAGRSGYLPAIPGGGSGYSMEILDAGGRVIVSSPETDRAGAISAHYPSLRNYMDARQPAVEIHRGVQPAPGDDLVVAVTPFLSDPFFLVLKQPTEIALMAPGRQQNELFAVATVALALALGVAWYTTRSVVGPVTDLRATARQFARGNLDHPVQVVAQDELAELADDIETMRRQLKISRDEIQQAKLELELKVEERTRRLQETLGKVFTAQEEERRRIALELHDEQSQALGALSVSLDRISHLLVDPSAPLSAEVQQARQMARSLLQETRRLIYDLRPSVLDDMGLEAAIRWCAETHLMSRGIQVALQSSFRPGRLPGAIEVGLFRIAQEAIVNIARHSEARHAAVVIEQHNGSLRMHVSDDGRGFVPGRVAASKTGGVGLEGMKERVRLMGGHIDISSEPGKGTKIELEVPLEKEASP